MIDLVIVPHPDDEVWGIGGYLASKKNKDTYILVMTSGSIGKNEVLSTRGQRLKEHRDALSILNIPHSHAEYLFFNDGCIGMDNYPLVVEAINDFINKYGGYKCNIWFPMPSYHQDHRYVHDVCITAVRPMQRVNANIYMYPYPGHRAAHKDGVPSYGQMYIPLKMEDVDTKINALHKFTTQIGETEGTLFHPSAQYELCRTQGMEIGEAYAEIVYPFRLVM